MPHLWRTTRLGLRKLFRRDAVSRDLDDELQHFLEMSTEENLRRGLSPDAAGRDARVRLGSFEAAKEEVRASGWEAVIDARRQDFVLAWRGLRRSPGFVLMAVSSLALGLGAATTLFGIANTALWRPLPYRDADRLALVWTDDIRRGLHQESTAVLTIADWKANARAFGDLAYFATERVAPMSNDPGGGRGRSRTALVSGNLFGLLGVSPMKGRLIDAADERARASVAVITFAFWQRWFHGSEDVIGRSIVIDDPNKGGAGSITVVGVLPPEFFFPDKITEIFTPATTYWRFGRESTERFAAWARRWTVVGRLQDKATIADARADFDRMSRQLTATYPTDTPDFPGFSTTVLSVAETIAGAPLRTSLALLLGAVAVVLLVVCANVSSLQLARGASRAREYAVQRALGAGRRRVILQTLTESAVLVALGSIAGTMLAAWATPILARAIAPYVPRMDEIAIDGRVLLFAVAAALVAALASGLAPALRVSSASDGAVLKDGGRGATGVEVRRSQQLLVFAECALALVLLTGAGLLLKSWYRLQAVDTGFDPARVLTVRLEFPPEPPPTAEERRQTSVGAQARAHARERAGRDVIDQVAALPGVTSVAMIDDLFIAGEGHASITVPGRPDDSIPPGKLNDAAVTSAFFTTMRVPLRRGRQPNPDDVDQKIRALWSAVITDLPLSAKMQRATAEPVVVNEAFVKRFFPNDEPIGRWFCTDPTNKTYWYEIVGVVGDMRRGGLERDSIPEFYGPYIPSPNGRVDLIARTDGEPLAIASTVRATIARAMPAVTILSISTVDEGLGGFSARRRLQMTLLTMLAGLALALAAIGIFGMAHYAVAQRTQEIGVRMALGATPLRVLRLLMGQGMRMPVIGIAAGLAASTAATRLLSTQLFGVTATDPWTFGVVAFALAAVAALACYLAARRAAGVDPMRALSRP